MIYFYDTSELLRELPILEDNDTLVICNIVWQELKQIKDDKRKSERTQRAAKKAIKWLTNNPFIMVKYKGELESEYEYINNDDRIIYCVGWYYFNEPFDDDFIFITHDKAMYLDAIEKDIPVSLTVDVDEPINEDYKGFKEYFLNNEELANFYEKGSKFEELQSNLLINEYLIIKYIDNDNECEQLYKNTEEGLQEVPYTKFISYQFGEIKPKDCYQKCVMDSLNTNQFTVITGPAGSGKSHLALAALFEKLDRHEINKIVMLVNPVCTDGAARLGYYKGTRDEKLLDCQVGGFLACKFGESYQAQQYIEQHKLELIPFSDLRGLDFNDKQVGILITEAQNLDKSMMKLAIQRAGEDSIIIVEGDPKTQLDMKQYTGDNNGMIAAINVFKGESLFGMIELQKIHRSKLAEIAERM